MIGFGSLLVCAASLTTVTLGEPEPAAGGQVVHPLSPEEEAKTFQVPEGYRLELVLSERDDVREPVNVTFDGDGRMYVAEMRSYMQDIHGTAQRTRNGRVSRHESSRHDGVFDKHTIFADKLLLPRMVLPLDDRVLINETDTLDIYSYRDTQRNGVADQKELVFKGGPVALNIEQQQSGLVWALDNWCYLTVKPLRLRFHPATPSAKPAGFGAWVKSWFSRPKENGLEATAETTPENGGQWGLAQDDFGKLWWSNGGAEIPFYHYQTPIIYGTYDMAGTEPSDFREVWPLVGLADVQGGPMRFRPEDRTLNHFTAACGQEIFRGDRLPEDLRGDAFICEPVGRLIRRAKVESKDGLTTIRNAFDHSEFLRSTDPCFRPVNLANGPDGCLYIVDMYRGVVQDVHWLPTDSYLYPVVQKYGLDKIVGCGRIWRLVHKDYPPGSWPGMLEESPAQWVSHLEHPNGWWRDTAQKLLVLRQDKSVVPALQTMASSSKSRLGRIHALWTLEGLNALSPTVVRQALKDPDPQVRIAAIRASESLCKRGDATLVPDLQALGQDPQPEVAAQTLLTGKLLGWPDYNVFAGKTLAAMPSKGLKDLGMLILNDMHGFDRFEFSKGETALLERGRSVYQQVCFACHGFDGKGMPAGGADPGVTLAPPLAGAREIADSPEAIVRILLHGLVGPVGGRNYSGPMLSMAANDDVWIAAVSSYVRNSFGNHGAAIAPEDVARLRAETKDRTTPWTITELETAMPQHLDNKRQWAASASANSQDAHLALDGNPKARWNTGGPAKPGDWFQIELPAATTVVGLCLRNNQVTEEFPYGYEVALSADGRTWSEPVARGHGTTGITEIVFAPAPAKFLRVTNTKHQRKTLWSIDDVEILTPAALATAKAK